MRRTWTIPGTERGPWVTEIECVLDDGPARVVMSGPIDLLAEPALSAALRTLASHPGPDAVADLRATTMLSCIGARFLYRLASQRGERGGTLNVQVVPGPAARILDLLGAGENMTIDHHPAPPCDRVVLRLSAPPLPGWPR